MGAKPNLLGVLVALAVSAASTTPAAATVLTLHNLCPFRVWPMVTPDRGSRAISNNTFRLEGDGHGLVSLSFPPSFWSGRLVARTGCTTRGFCESGDGPPATVVTLSVHAGDHNLAAYSVSLADGFNVPAVVSPHAIGGGQCPALGCAADLNADCPRSQRVFGYFPDVVVACRAGRDDGSYFKERCPLTRTTPTDVEPIPQRCIAPGELKVVFCQAAMVKAGHIRTVVDDN